MLTTHSMEEVEALSDTVGILLGGELKCIGTPQHLKLRFGDGYYLRASIGDQHDAVVRFLKAECDEVGVVAQTKSISEFVLKSKRPLSTLFSVVESMRHEFEVEDATLSQPTLEQIFNWFVRDWLQASECAETKLSTIVVRGEADIDARVGDPEDITYSPLID